MVTHTDPFIINTNLGWDGSGPIVDQLKGKSFGVDGHTVGDFTAETTAAYIVERSTLASDTYIDGLYGVRVQDRITVGPGSTLPSKSGLLEFVVGIRQYSIELVDGTVLTQANFGNVELPVRTLDNSTGRLVLIDFYDVQQMSVLNTMPAIAKISFPANATQNSDYGRYLAANFDQAYTPTAIPCFTAGTMIATPGGVKRIDDLRAGDLIETRDGGALPIGWIGSRRLTGAELRANPKIRPIRITAGSLGANVPLSDLVVSPQHRVFIRSRIAHRMFGTSEILTAAKNLLNCPGVEVTGDQDEVTYFHILLDAHHLIFANGAWSETLYLGAQAKFALNAAQLEEIRAIFPALSEPSAKIAPARIFANGSAARKLVGRSIQNGKALVSDLMTV